MTKKINLVVDYEDRVDWLQDSVVIENVDLNQNHYDFIVELEQAVFDATRFMINPQVPIFRLWAIHLPILMLL